MGPSPPPTLTSPLFLLPDLGSTQTVVEFKFDPPARLRDAPLWLDFTGRTIETLVVNGTELDPLAPGVWERNRLCLPRDLLSTVADNTVDVTYVNDHDNDGDGL